MEENSALDDFIRKTVEEVGLEKAPVDFTNSVMSKIKTEAERSSVFIHRPLISKFTWFVIISVVVAVFAYVIFGNQDTESTWFSILQLNRLAAFNQLGRIPSPVVSNTFVYGFLIFAFFAVVQVIMIKKRFNKQYSLN